MQTIQGVPVGVALIGEKAEWTATDKRLMFRRLPEMVERDDGWGILESFLAARTETDVLVFLNDLGCFHGPRPTPEDWYRELPDIFEQAELLTTVGDFFAWQSIFKQLLAERPLSWGFLSNDTGLPFKVRLEEDGNLYRRYGGLLDSLGEQKASAIADSGQFTIKFLWRTGAGHWARIEATDILRAILATIYLVHLGKSEINFCELSDCQKPFKLTSAHHRKYCTPEHAHLATVRRGRARAAKKKKLKKAHKKTGSKK